VHRRVELNSDLPRTHIEQTDTPPDFAYVM
jgi:hypothetical protein